MAIITTKQMAHFEEHGYLLVKGLFDPQKDLDPIIDEYTSVLDNLANELYAKGKINSTYSDLPFGERLIAVYNESGQVHSQYFDFSLPQSNVQTDTPFWAGPAVFHNLTNPKLLDAVASFVGPEIYSNPVQHVRIKPPENRTPVNIDTGRIQLGITPWHQDSGVVLPEADATNMLTVWFPLTNASIEHGCLEVIPGSHRHGLMHHCPGPWGLEVPAVIQQRNEAIPIPMERGDVLFMTRLTIHSSLPNKSEEIRWSFDLRYQPIGQPTGREAFPGFVARSKNAPTSELRDPAAWETLWRTTRDHLAVQDNRPFNRWSADHLLCA